MLMHHGIDDKPPKPEQIDALKELVAMTKAWDRSLVDHSTSDRYEVTIAKNAARALFGLLALLSAQSC
jgi:hypothetical protein